jgi:hypothetical protein
MRKTRANHCQVILGPKFGRGFLPPRGFNRFLLLLLKGSAPFATVGQARGFSLSWNWRKELPR